MGFEIRVWRDDDDEENDDFDGGLKKTDGDVEVIDLKGIRYIYGVEN